MEVPTFLIILGIILSLFGIGFLFLIGELIYNEVKAERRSKKIKHRRQSMVMFPELIPCNCASENGNKIYYMCENCSEIQSGISYESMYGKGSYR